MELMTDRALANGARLRCEDLSKKVAGDRWLVRLRCVLTCPPAPWMEADIDGSDDESAWLRHELADGLRFEQEFERNFVDEGDREEILAGFLERVEAMAAGYLGGEAFVRHLFTRRLAELRQQYVVEKARGREAAVEEDDDGPADFSHCFR